MFSVNNDEAAVDSWIQSATKDLSPLVLPELFNQALAAVWQRSFVTLGGTTMEAIAVRILCGCREKFAWLDGVTYSNEGFCLKDLDVATLPEDILRQGLRCILLDFLNLLGALTAETLTPQLYIELSMVGNVKKIDPSLDREFVGRITNK